MKERLFFLVNDEKQALAVADELTKIISKDDIHIIARHDKKLISEDLPDAQLDKSSDIAGAAKRGATVGGVLFAGLAATVIPPIGAVATLGVIAGGAVLGSWSSTLIGVSVPHDNIEEFQDKIDNGHILMLVDTSVSHTDDLKAKIETAVPNAQIHTRDIEV